MKTIEKLKKVNWLYCMFYGVLVAVICDYGAMVLVAWLRSKGVLI
jgi:hypothetical protein